MADHKEEVAGAEYDLPPPDYNQSAYEAGYDQSPQPLAQPQHSGQPSFLGHNFSAPHGQPRVPCGQPQQLAYDQQQLPHGQPPLPYSELDAEISSTSAVTVMQRPYDDPSTWPRPEDYYGLSWFVCFCCCTLFGLVALICSMQSRSLYNKGNAVGARSASRAALVLNILGIVTGITCVIVILCIHILQ